MSVHTTYNVSQVVGRAALTCVYGAPWKKRSRARGPKKGGRPALDGATAFRPSQTI
jgi:hypothetical protein